MGAGMPKSSGSRPCGDLAQDRIAAMAELAEPQEGFVDRSVGPWASDLLKLSEHTLCLCCRRKAVTA